MSNLGMYQTMTELAKKAGGPTNLAVGYAIFSIIAFEGSKFIVKSIYKKLKKSGNEINQITQRYTVKKDGVTNNNIHFKKSDQFIILNNDGDTYIIYRLNDKNGPYAVSLDFLKEISDI